MENNEIEKLAEFEKKLAIYEGEDRVIPFEEVLEYSKENQKRVFFVKSNIPTLDKMLGGFEPGELIVISGITGEGKTSLCQTFTSAFSEQGVKCLWFSYEMPALYFLRKFPVLPIAYMPRILKVNTMSWIEYRIWEAKLKYDVKVVFVDHLHYLIDLARGQNASLEIGSIMRSIKKLALKHNIIFFLIAHTTRIRFDTEPDLGFIRDSSFIEQEADTVMYIWRIKQKKVTDGDNLAYLKVAKNRKLGIVGKKVELQMINNQFKEVTLDYETRDKGKVGKASAIQTELYETRMDDKPF